MRKAEKKSFRRTEIAIFLATSGHSGVDRIMTNLVREMGRRGLDIDLLKIHEHGPNWEGLPENVRIHPLGASHVQTALPALVRYLKEKKPRCLLTDKDRVNRTALIANRLAGAKTKITIRMGTTVTKNLERRSWMDRNIQLFSMRTFYRWADAIIVPSRGAAEDLAAAARIPIKKIRVVPSPVITEEIYELAKEPAPHEWLQTGELPVILGAGELCARKDFETIIKAFAILKKTYPSRLIILGKGKKKQDLLALTESLGLNVDVSFPGFVNNPYAYMSRASLFVLSSRCEGSPVVLMEALALGVPVVSTDCPSGPNEILQNGRYGQLVPVGDFEALSKVMLVTLKNPLSSEDLKAAATRFNTKENTDQYLAAMGFKKDNS